MASKKLGHTACPECGHQEAHIKISLDGEGKKPYRHCPECYASYHPRNKHQADMLMAKMKDGAPAPEKDAPPAAPPPAQAPAPEKEKLEYEMVFGVRVPKRKVEA